jgi:cytosine deaminase
MPGRKEERDDPFMQEAIREAETGRREGGIPIGSVLVQDGRIIGRGHNRRVQDGDPILHAEIDCLRHAGRIGSYRNTTLYSTLMPCYLCAGAVVQFRIPRVVAGSPARLREPGPSLRHRMWRSRISTCRNVSG